MNNSSLSALVLVFGFGSVMAQAFGNKDTWSSGWGQGVSEFVIKRKVSRSYICPVRITAHSRLRSYLRTLTGMKSVWMKIKTFRSALTVERPLISVNLAVVSAAITWCWLWTQLRNGKQVSVSGEGVKPATFTLAGAAKVLPEFGTHGCVAKASL